MALRSVRVPPRFEGPFAGAEKVVANYFASMDQDAARGAITIGGERYVLVRAMSLSVHFLEFLKDMYPGLTESEALEGAGSALFDIAFAIGRSDARAFCRKLDVEDPVAKLSAGPIHFAHSGWAFVEIADDSSVEANEDFFLVYDHPQSFEADSWLTRGEHTEFCTCHMNAGYSAGWSTESFGIDLVAREILCRARGDETCRFVMAPPERIDQRITEYLEAHACDA